MELHQTLTSRFDVGETEEDVETICSCGAIFRGHSQPTMALIHQERELRKLLNRAIELLRPFANDENAKTGTDHELAVIKEFLDG